MCKVVYSYLHLKTLEGKESITKEGYHPKESGVTDSKLECIWSVLSEGKIYDYEVHSYEKALSLSFF